MTGEVILALILIIGALVCFLADFFKTGFSLVTLGLACLAGFFLVQFVVALN